MEDKSKRNDSGNKLKLANRMMFFSFISFILIILIANIWIPDRKFSDSENRVLKGRPEFSLKDFIDGDWTKGFDQYMADQFAFRDFWIGVKSDSDRAMGKNESNGIYLGKDQFLLQKFENPDEEDFKTKMDKLNSFAASIPGVNKYFMLVPNSVKIWEEKLPLYAPVDDERLYMKAVQDSLHKDLNVIDVYETLKSSKDEYLYYKTDHHWTTKGAFYAYQVLAEHMGFSAHDEDYFQVREVTEDFYGSSYSKSGFRHLRPDKIELYLPVIQEKYTVTYHDYNIKRDSFYFMENLDKKDKYAVFFGGNQSLIHIKTERELEILTERETNTHLNKETEKGIGVDLVVDADNYNKDTKTSASNKLLVIKDSYANCFLPFLTGHFSDIYVVDRRFFREDLDNFIEENHINDVLMIYNVDTFSQIKDI